MMIFCIFQETIRRRISKTAIAKVPTQSLKKQRAASFMRERESLSNICTKFSAPESLLPQKRKRQSESLRKKRRGRRTKGREQRCIPRPAADHKSNTRRQKQTEERKRTRAGDVEGRTAYYTCTSTVNDASPNARCKDCTQTHTNYYITPS